MANTARLRHQAAFCLRLSELCSDQPLSRHLSFLGARYHEAALRVEFGCEGDDAEIDADGSPIRPQTRWH